MIRELPPIKTKQELMKALQSMKLEQIEIIEPYDPKQSNELTKMIRQMSAKSGSVSIILLRSH
jgi:isopropylmalate/homocitrate/citramalate synthase